MGSLYRGGLGGRLLLSNTNDGREVPEMSYLVKYSLAWGLSRRLVRSALIASAVVGVVTASLTVVAAAPARPVAKPQGTCGVVDLTPPGTSASSATAINDRGQVAGISSGSPSFGSFLWQDGRFTDLGAGADSGALGLNDRGQVVGFEPVGISRHAFLWEQGVLHDLGNFGFQFADASDINNRGQVAGGHDHAFLWENGTEHDLGTLGGFFSGADAINGTADRSSASRPLPRKADRRATTRSYGRTARCAISAPSSATPAIRRPTTSTRGATSSAPRPPCPVT